MTRDDIIKLAREVGISVTPPLAGITSVACMIHDLERFYHLAT